MTISIFFNFWQYVSNFCRSLCASVIWFWACSTTAFLYTPSMPLIAVIPVTSESAKWICHHSMLCQTVFFDPTASISGRADCWVEIGLSSALILHQQPRNSSVLHGTLQDGRERRQRTQYCSDARPHSATPGLMQCHGAAAVQPPDGRFLCNADIDKFLQAVFPVQEVRVL